MVMASAALTPVSPRQNTGLSPFRANKLGISSEELELGAAGELTSDWTSSVITMNTFWPTEEVVASLVSRLRPHELRWLAKDVLKAGLDACRTGAIDALEKAVVGWIETADIIISERRRLRHILRARQEGRERFGGANPSL